MISVIIPTYNRARTIERSVNSVLQQTYKDIECIVVDDCSTDNTKEIVENITDTRVRYYCLEKNFGACVARNYGVEKAKGDYIAFQDSDDEWLPNKLEEQFKYLVLNNADVCFCKKYILDINGDFAIITRNELQQGFISREVLCSQSKVSTQTILAKRNVFNEFKFDPNLKKAQDFEWTIGTSEKYTFYFVDQPLVKQYLQDDSITIVGKNYQKDYEARKYIYEKYHDKYNNDKKLAYYLMKGLAYYKTIYGMSANSLYLKCFWLDKKGKTLLEGILPPFLLKQYFLRKEQNVQSYKYKKRKNNS